ncbi:MAG: LamG domain-containing protein [Armatimonadetes bacterium]|nr:LamG domain-containing protein [Armatimonadota bacterium]
MNVKLSFQAVTVLLCVAAILGASCTCSAVNLLSEPGFEIDGTQTGYWFDNTTYFDNNSPTLWVGQNIYPESRASTWATPQYHSGSQALQLAYAWGNADCYATQTVAVAPSATYTASVWFTGSWDLNPNDNPTSAWGINANQKAALTVQQFDSAGNAIGSQTKVYANVSSPGVCVNNWQQLTYTFSTGASTAKVAIGGWTHLIDGYSPNLGRAIFDDFVLDGPPAPGPSTGGAPLLPQFRGADLTGGVYQWPFMPAYWNTAIWPGNKTAKDEVNAYMERLKASGFNAIRVMLFTDANPNLPWDAQMQQNLCEYITMAEEHGLKIYFYLSITSPAYNDGIPSDQGVIWPDGTVPSPCLSTKSDNPALYNAVIAHAKVCVDRTVGYVAMHKPASSAIIGWSVGFDERPYQLCNIDYIKDMTTYVKQVDPYHPVGIEHKCWALSNGQLYLLPNAPGYSDPEITSHNVYNYLDFIGMADYDLDTGVERIGPYPFATKFLPQLTAQNLNHKPVILEEYGVDSATDWSESYGSGLNMLESARGAYLLQRVNSNCGVASDVQGTFLWDAHVSWDERPPINQYSVFKADHSQPYYIGSPHLDTKVLMERFWSHAWASYTFDDICTTTTATDGEGSFDLTLRNGAAKAAGRTGKGLLLNGVNAYASKSYDPSMNQQYLYFQAWVNSSAWQNGGIVSRYGSWTIQMGGDGKLHIWANTGSGWAGKLDSTGTLPIGTWTRVAVTYDGRYWRIYFNGTLDSSAQDLGMLVANTADLCIGSNGSSTPLYFAGGIDEVQICPIPGPLVRFKCDETGGSTLSDCSGNGLNATLYGGYDRNTAQVLPDGNTISFNGATGYATVPDTANKTTGCIGLDFYVYPRDTTSLQYVLSQGEQTSGSGWGIYILNGELCFAVNTDTVSNGYDVVIKRAIPAANTWCHVRAGYDGTVGILSVNGDEFDAVGSGPIVYRNAENITLGRLACPAGWYYFNGALDEVQVYSTFISGGQPAIAPTPPNLIGQWTFDTCGGTGPLENKAAGANWSQMLLSGTGVAVREGVLALPRYLSGSTWKQSYATTMLQTDLGPKGYSKDNTQVLWIKWPGFDPSFWGRLTNVGKFPSSTFSLTALKSSESIIFRSGFGWGSCRVWEDVSGGTLGVHTGWSYLGGANPPTDRFIKIARVLRMVDSTNYQLQMYWDIGDSQGLVALGTPVTIPASQINAFGQYGTNCLAEALGGLRYDGLGLMEPSSWANVQSEGEIDFDEVRLYQGALSQAELGALTPYVVSTRPAVGTSIKSLFSPVAATASSEYDWVVWGRVTVVDPNTITLNDGSGSTLTVHATGHGLVDGEYVSVRGALNTVGNPRTLAATSIIRRN